jgi:hypothetical protein
MLSEYEARKLQEDMKRELNTGPATVIRYGVLMLLIVGLAWTGTPSNDAVGRDSAAPAPQASADRVRHSRAAFEERRQRFIAAYPDSQIARESAVQRQESMNLERRRHIAFDSE